MGEDFCNGKEKTKEVENQTTVRVLSSINCVKMTRYYCISWFVVGGPSLDSPDQFGFIQNSQGVEWIQNFASCWMPPS